MFSVTSMRTYGNYFVYGGAYYAWVNERHSFQSMADSKFVTSHENREYIFFPKRGGGGGGGGRGGGGQSKVGYLLKR